MKKIFTLFAALMMIFSMNAATKTIYCKMAQSWWKADGAAVGAYYWGTGGNANSWPGTRMTAVAGETDLWSIDIDTDKHQNIIFTRVNGSGTIADWGTKTGDLTIPTDNKNLFTITNTSASWGGGCVGNWSVYAPEAPKTYKNITITVVANATPKIHYWEGGDKMVGTDYNSMPEMNATGAANTYSYTIKDVDEATGVNYLIKVGAVQSSDQHADKDVTINFKEILPQVAVQGVNNWNGTDVMTVADDYLSASITLPLIAKKYDLKLTVAGAWKGHKNENNITRTNNSSVFKNDDGNGSITADIAGDYVFTYTYANQTLTVTYPALPVKYNVTVTAENGTVTGAGEYEEGKEATLTATPAEGYEFINWTKGEEVVSTENPYKFTVTADVALVANFAKKVYTVTVAAENGTVEGLAADGKYEHGAEATLTATPAEGYEFVNWTKGEEVVSTENTYTFTVTADIALVANFQATEPVVELPAASVRAWAYDLALAVEGEQYTFSYKATTAALATLIFTDVDGEELATKDLGLVEAGANTVVLAADELPAGQKVNWAVKLEAGAIAELAEVTDQTRGIYDFYNMMDVLVDNNPESENFGKIYIQMALNGESDGSTTRSKAQKAGFFVYDQALNELNPTSNVGILPVVPAEYGVIGEATRNRFHRLDIDPKTGKITWCYNVDAQPAVFAIDPANLAGEATNLLAGIEGLSRTAAHCYDAEGTLYVMNIVATSKGAIYKIVDGQAVQMTEFTTKWLNASMTLAADGNGGLWVAQNRGQMDGYYQLAHVNAAGELDYTVWSGNTNGFTGSSARGALAYDAERKLLAQGRNGVVEVYSVAYDAETGVPALTLVASTPTVGTNIDGLHFDYAGDLYVVNSSKEKFQKFAMPTNNNVCTTPAASKYAFQLEGKTEVEYEVYEDEITNLVIDYDNMLLIGGPSANIDLEVDVYLSLGDYDRNTDKFALLPESSVAIRGIDATFVEGWASVDGIAQTANAVVRCVWNEMNIELHLAMSAAPLEATVVVVENAVIEIEKYLLFGDMYDYALKMTGVWKDSTGVEYPVLVEVPVYYPEATEPYEMYSTVTVGGMGDEDPWLGFGEGYLTITPEGEKITATGVVENPMAGIAIDITISGSLSQGPGTALENATVVIKSIKKIQNGQLIIEKGGVQYNAQGAVIK